MEFNFRNDSLRRKYDAVKYNVKKLEELVYGLSFLENIKNIQD